MGFPELNVSVFCTQDLEGVYDSLLVFSLVSSLTFTNL